MIRILHMIGSLNIGGSQAMIMNLYRNIDREKIQFDFIIDHSDHLYFADEIKSMGGEIFVLPSFTGTNIVKIKRAWDDFFSNHSEYRILHSHVRSYASIYLPIAKKHGVKTIIHSHSTSNGKGISSIVKTIMQYPLRYQADYFFGCSKEAGEWLFGKKIVNSNRYFMLKNAINLSSYRPNEDMRKSYRLKIGAAENTVVFIHVGRFHEAKNHLFLLEVFSAYLKININSLLVLVGDGELRPIIENKINELKILGKVIILGARNDVPNWLRAADCFLFPSKWEGLPVTVVEAQAAGVPCLISDKITKDVVISKLVTVLPIDTGVNIWSKELQESNLEKQNVEDKIKENGFDITDSCTWLTAFYRKIS